MLRRNARLRREYLYRKGLEGRERAAYEKKRRIRQALQDGKPIPTELRGEEAALRAEIELEDEATAEPASHVDDEYAQAGRVDPKILLTTSRDPSSRLTQFAKARPEQPIPAGLQLAALPFSTAACVRCSFGLTSAVLAPELKIVLPNAQRINRGGQASLLLKLFIHHCIAQIVVIAEVVEACRKSDFTDIVMVHEHRGEPDGLIVCHLPFGPTAYFGLLNVVTRHDIKDKAALGTMSEAYPHLIMDKFTTKAWASCPLDLVNCFPGRIPLAIPQLGQRTSNILKYLFPVPKSDSKRIITFANQSDFISFRHHVYEMPKGPKSVELKEVGPRFELRLYQIKLGTMDQTEAENEWRSGRLSTETTSSPGSNKTDLLPSAKSKRKGSVSVGSAHLVIASAVGMLHRVHGHSPHLGPAVALHSVLVIRVAGLEHGLLPTWPTMPRHPLGTTFLAPEGSLMLRNSSAGVGVVGDDDGVVAGGAGKGAAVAQVVLHVADDGALGHGAQREDVADGERGFLAAIDELAGVHALGGHELLLDVAEPEGVAEGNARQRRAAPTVVQDLRHHALDVPVALCVVQLAQPRGPLPLVRVRPENAARALALRPDHAPHGAERAPHFRAPRSPAPRGAKPGGGGGGGGGGSVGGGGSRACALAAFKSLGFTSTDSEPHFPNPLAYLPGQLSDGAHRTVGRPCARWSTFSRCPSRLTDGSLPLVSLVFP
eukprot:SM000001S04679  [mRNA]  locus=s1:1641799:1646343:- [translate_table: standard]